MSELVHKFIKHLGISVENWEHWKEEYNYSDRLIIAGPSRITALIDLTKIDEDIEWTPYSTISVPTKKMKGNFVFCEHIYAIYFLRKMFEFIGESVEVASFKDAILFKLSETVAIGIGCKLTSDDFYCNDEGVMFVEFDWEETKDSWKTTTTKKEFIKWVDGVAKRKHKGNVHVWDEEVYQFEKFFELEEEEGDFLSL